MSTRNLGFALGQLAKTEKNRRGSDMGVFAKAVNWVAQHLAASESIEILSRVDFVKILGGYIAAADAHFTLAASHEIAAPAADSAESFKFESIFKVPTLGTDPINLVGGGANDFTVQLNYVTDHFELAFGDDLAAIHVTGVDLAGVLVGGDVIRVTVTAADRELGAGNITWVVDNLSKNLTVSGSVANTDKIVGALDFQYFGQANATENADAVTYYRNTFWVGGVEYLKFDFAEAFDTATPSGVISDSKGNLTITEADFVDVGTNYEAGQSI